MMGSSHSPGFPFSCTYSPPHEEGNCPHFVPLWHWASIIEGAQ